MKRPSFQFYPSDWQSDLKLRRCSPAARGVWLDILCAFHDSDDGYGLLRWPLKEIASTVGASLAHVRELVDKGVLRGSDTGITEPLVYVPRSGRKDGEPVTLIDTQPGPLWYSKRMVKDEHIRTIRGEATRFGADEGAPPKQAPKASPKPPLGDGTSSSSSSSSSKNTPKPPDGGFDEFWAAYPRKTAKASAIKAWGKLDPDAELQARLLTALAVQRQSEQWRRDGGQFVPHPATWLNGRRWEDEAAGTAPADSVFAGAVT